MKPFPDRKSLYKIEGDGTPGSFHITKAPTHAELAQVLEKIILKTTKYLEKRGLIRRDEEDNVQLNIDEDDALAKLQTGAQKPADDSRAWGPKTT